MEVLIVGLGTLGFSSLVVAWLSYRYLLLERRMEEMEAGLAQLRAPGPTGLEDSVAQMVDQLKAAADIACNQVARQVEELRQAWGIRPAPVAVTAEVASYPAVAGARELAAVAASHGSMAVARPPISSDPPPISSDPVEDIVWLAGEGLEPAEISRLCGLGQQEVEAVLRFHRVDLSALATSGQGSAAGHRQKAVPV